MITMTYLSVTTSIIDQNTSDSRPEDVGLVRLPARSAWPKASLRVYSGLVPMSPNTTPMAPTISGQGALVDRPRGLFARHGDGFLVRLSRREARILAPCG